MIFMDYKIKILIKSKKLKMIKVLLLSHFLCFLALAATPFTMGLSVRVRPASLA